MYYFTMKGMKVIKKMIRFNNFIFMCFMVYEKLCLSQDLRVYNLKSGDILSRRNNVEYLRLFG